MRPHRRYTEGEKKILLDMMTRAKEKSDKPLSCILIEQGFIRSVDYDWLSRGEERRLTDHILVPRSPLAALPEEIEAEVACTKAHPRDGYRHLAWMMVDEDFVYICPLLQDTESWTDMTYSIGGRGQSRARAGGSMRPIIRMGYGILNTVNEVLQRGVAALKNPYARLTISWVKPSRYWLSNRGNCEKKPPGERR